jgi:hypothetical protein
MLNTLQLLDRMNMSRETSRRVLRKENERRLSVIDNIAPPSAPVEKVET